MKAGLFCFAGLSAVAVAQPHRRHHHAPREVVTDIETDVATATAVQNVMIYVNEAGQPTSTSYAGAGASSSAAAAEKYGEHPKHQTHAPASYSSSSSSTSTSISTSVYVAPTTSSSTTVSVAPTTYSTPSTTETPTSTKAPSTTSTEAPATSTKASSTPAAYSSSSAAASTPSTYSSGSGLGLTYSPYKADGTCKSTEEVATDFEQLDGYGQVRTYGTDCNQVANVLAAAKPKGMKLFAGIFDIDAVVSELSTISSAVDGDWSVIDTIAIGNELVNSGTKTVGEVAAAVTVAKAQLLLSGYTGPVVTVDTFVAIIANPGLCEVGDYVAANCHAFFDGGVTADQAGEFVLSQTQRVSAACGGKKTVITESGWPSQGDANKEAVPSEANQKAAVSSLQSSFASGLYLFNAYNDMWKKDNSGTFGAEKYWGIHGMSAAN